MPGKGPYMQWNADTLLQEFKKTLAGIWSVKDKHDWPVRFNTVSHLFAREFFKDVEHAFDSLARKNYSRYEIAGLFGGASQILRSFDLLLRGMYLMKIPAVEKRQFVTELLQCAQEIKHGSILNEDGVNRILDEDSLQRLKETGDWKTAGGEASLAVHQLIGMMKAYAEILYFRIYDISQEIHGPYGINGGASILVREFHNLAPVELWSEYRFVGFNSLCVYTEYDEAVRLRIDAYNHMVQEGAGFPEHLKKWRVLADGKEVEDTRAMDMLKQQVCDAIRWNAAVIESYDWRQITVRYAQICWYKIKRLQEEADITDPAYRQVAGNIREGTPQRQNERFFEGDRVGMLINILL